MMEQSADEHDVTVPKIVVTSEVYHNFVSVHRLGGCFFSVPVISSVQNLPHWERAAPAHAYELLNYFEGKNQESYPCRCETVP
jgi:hypothetical protein